MTTPQFHSKILKYVKFLFGTKDDTLLNIKNYGILKVYDLLRICDNDVSVYYFFFFDKPQIIIFDQFTFLNRIQNIASARNISK